MSIAQTQFETAATTPGVAAETPRFGYIGFWRGQQKEVYATSSYTAQQELAKLFKAKKPYDVTVILAEKDGQPVVHTADF